MGSFYAYAVAAIKQYSYRLKSDFCSSVRYDKLHFKFFFAVYGMGNVFGHNKGFALGENKDLAADSEFSCTLKHRDHRIACGGVC